MPQSLNELETRFFGLIQSRRLDVVEAGDLVRLLGVTVDQERKTLSRLARRGMIARVRRGKYVVPEHLPVGGAWSPSEARVLTSLMADRDGRYQICGPNAFQRYGWDEQVPNRIFAYNNRLSGDRAVGPVSLTMIRVTDDRLGSTDKAMTPEGLELVYSSRVRSLVDAVYDWSRFDSLPRGFAWIRDELVRDRGLAAELVDVCLRFGNQGTIRRIGRVLDQHSAPAGLLRRLERSLRKTSSLIPWIPTVPKRGTIDRRWGLVINGQ